MSVHLNITHLFIIPMGAGLIIAFVVLLVPAIITFGMRVTFFLAPVVTPLTMFGLVVGSWDRSDQG